MLDALLRDTNWIASAGDLGCFSGPVRSWSGSAAGRISQVGAQEALARFPDGTEGCTMEVAWYLTGIANCYLAGYADLPGLAAQAAAARQILERNCGVSGVYGHLSRGTNR